MRLFGVIALATLIGGAAQASTVNLVTNGSFEDNPLGSGNWSHFSNVPGWTGDPNVEIQSNRTLGSIDAKDGSYYAELDTNQDAGMFQDIFLNAGSYDFSFFYSPRVNDTNTATNDMFYSFKDMATQTLTLLSGTISGAPNASYPHGVWTEVNGTLRVQTAATYRLTFEARGGSFYGGCGNCGALIDDVSLTGPGGPIDNPSPVPLPAGFALLLTGMGGLAVMRRRG